MINILLLLLFELSSANNITQCNECINTIKTIKNSSSINKYLNYLDNFCRLTNNTKCETYITKLEHNIKHMNASDVCYELEYCDRLSFDNILFTSQDFPIVYPIPSNCKVPIEPFRVSYLKYYNKLIAMYDANSYDKYNCYGYHNNYDVFNLQPIWEIKFDSEILFHRSQTISLNYWSICYQNDLNLEPSLYVIGTKNYLYYILNNGTIFTKFKTDGVIVTTNFNNGVFTPYHYSRPNITVNNNETYFNTKNSLYSVKLIVSIENKGKPIGDVCKINDIVGKKIYSFN